MTQSASFSVEALEYRLRAANLPAWGRDWSFETFPRPPKSDPSQVRAWGAVQEWALQPARHVPGLVLWGPPGRGKTGLGLAALRTRIEAGDGSAFAWLVSAGPEIEGRVHQGLVPREPAPVWFERWADLKARLFEARGADEEGVPKTARAVLRALDLATDLLMLDDVDQDAMSPWKEEHLLFLVERPLRGKRLLLTLNAGVETIVDRLGARIVDRLLDRQRFLLVPLGTGESLRR